MLRRRPISARSRALLAAAALAVLAGVVAYSLGALGPLESEALSLRFALRGASRPNDVAVVAVDERTFSELGLRWPFPRRLDGEAIERLRADGARTIVFDVQFTEPSDPADDLALYDAVRRAGNVVLATTEVDEHGETDVLGGEQNVRAAHAVVGAANLPSDADGVLRRYDRTVLGLPSLAVAAARRDGHAPPASAFRGGSALIDFRGPPGTVPNYSFSRVLRGGVPARLLRGRTVVIGAAAPTLGDVHPTSTASSEPMAGPEIQANAIWTALHGNPLAPAPGWLALLTIALAGVCAPLASTRLRASRAALASAALALAYLGAAQLAFDAGTVLEVAYPLLALATGAVGMLAANYVGALVERNQFQRRLQQSQIELVRRLAAAVESRDAETGAHIARIGALCERLALELGWPAQRARMLGQASAMHDVGKIGIPDSVLLKPGTLDEREWQVIRSHTTLGGEILAGSQSPLVQMAERIARFHHERWDGTGYPDGLRGEQIPIEARICSVCDVFDALLSHRSYKHAWHARDALAELRRCSGAQLDPQLVAAFMRIAPTLPQVLDASEADAPAPLALATPQPA